nr:nuclear pore complex protein Nup214 [Halyomorpha halys]
MVENPPISRDVKEFKFKLKCRLKVFPQVKVENSVNLLAAASKYGVIFAGSPNGVQCIRTDSVLSLDSDHRHSKNVTAYPKRTLQLGVQPSHLGVSADNELLAVALIPSDCAVLYIYSVASFGGAEVIKKCEVRLSNTAGVTVSDLQWNPGMPNVLAVVMADGSAAVIEFKDNSFIIVGSIPQNSQASCLCWSPKGKQVVIGAKNGSLTQYKPELKAVKTFPPPQVQGTAGLSVVSVHWLSNFQFIAAYRPFSDPSARANLMVVNVPKNSPTTYVNYEDFCFGSNTSRPEHYFIHQSAWNMLIVGTTNSMDANILGMDGERWVQWMLDDGGRAELPLTNDHQDVYNIGMCFDTSPTQPVPIGENISVDPMPLLIMLSHDGVLCYFQAINLLQGAAKLCQPPQQFPDSSGLHFFSLPEAGDALSPNQTKEEQKVPDVKELGQQAVQPVQPNVVSSVPAPQSMGQPLISQASPSQAPLAQPFNMNFSFGQQSFAQSLNFNQPSLASPASQPSTLPISKFLGSQATQGQTSSGSTNLGQSLGGLPFGQAAVQNTPQSTFGTAGGFSQSMWHRESNQKPGPITSKQSSPAQQILTSDQAQQSSYSPTQPTFSPQQSNSTPVITESQPDFPQPTSQESTSTVNQTQGVPNTSQSTSNYIQSNEINKTPQFLSQGSTNSLPILAVSAVQPSSMQPESSKAVPVPEIVEESDEKKLMKEMEVCQALLQNFSVEMEQKQAVIKFISSQTESNISESKLKDQIIQDIEKLRKFEEEIKATGTPDQSDVTALGNSILEIFGWYEKIKAKERMVKNPGYIELMESQDLDPITKNYLNNIDRYVYYVESQIKLAKAKLSSMWDNIGYLSVCNDKCMKEWNFSRMRVRQGNTSVKGCSSVVELASFIYIMLLHDLELSTLAERLLDTRISDSDLPQDKSIRDASMNYIMLSKRMAKKNLNEDKVSALHQWHKNHKVITTKVSKKSAIIVNGDISKDETFYRAISPNKQSTPYLHATPKKAISSIPRKSLFTLTSNMGNAHLDTSETNATVVEETEQNHPAENKNSVAPQVLSEVLKTSKSNYSPSSLDPFMKNNLATSITKVVDGNKINGIENTANISVDLTKAGSSSQLNTLSTVPSPVTKDPIPTPAFFKGVPSEDQSWGKENAISTSWGAQTPVFSQIYASPSNISTSVKTTLTSSKSIFSGSLSTGGSVTSSAPNVSSFSFNLSGSQPSSSAKSIFSQSNPLATNPLSFSAHQKSSLTSSESEEKELHEPLVTTVSAIYNPSNVRSASSSTTFGVTTTTVTSVVSSISTSNSNVPPVATTSSFQINLPLSASIANQFSAINSSLTITPIPANSNIGANFTLGAPSSSSVPTGTTSVSPVVSVQSKPKSTPLSANLFSVPVPNYVMTSNQLTVSSQSQSAPETNPTSVTTEVVSHKSSVPTWTGVSSLISSGTLTTSSSTTSASIFGGTSVFGSLKTPVVSSQSTLSGTPVFASSAPTSRVFNSTLATTNTNVFGAAAAAVTTSSVFGSTAPPTTSSVSSATATSDSVITAAESSSTLSFVSLPANSSSLPTFSTSNTTVATPATSVFGYSTSASSVFHTTSSTSPLMGNGSNNTTAVTTASVFSITPATTSVSIFREEKITPSEFGSTPKTTTSIFGTATTSASFFGNNSVFGGSNTTSATSVFGGSNTTTASSVFGGSNTTSTSSVFGGTNTTTTASSVFGGAGSTTSSSFFGAVANPTSTSSLFGTTTTTSSVFGAANTTTTSSIFGTSASAPSMFGASNTTTTSSIFGTPSTTSTSSVFGTSSTTTTSSVFGTPSTTSTSSVFGTSSTTTTSSVFGTPSTTSTSSVFGTPSTTSSSSVFGTPSTTSSSIFGSPNATTTSSVFGTANTTTSSSGFGSQSNQGSSIFGAAAALSSTSFFGSPTTTSSSFGNQSAASIFGGSSSFGTPSTTNSFFGKPICSPTSTTTSVFGSTSNVFGTTTTTSTSSIFGGNGFQQKSSPFGQTTSSVFGQTPTSAGNFGTSGGSLFGGTPSFGSPSAQGNIFQSSGTGNIFGAAANASPFSGTGQPASQPTFGSPPSFQSAQRPFGTAAPVFGGQSTFGASPTFGGSPTFGAPGGQTFGSPGQHSSTFENLANQDTLSFGNLAQQQPFPTTSFGGSSFSSWRS